MYYKKGDIITIEWENLTSLFNVEVIDTPCQPTDNLVVKDKDGTMYYIQYYSRIIKENQT